MYAYCGNNPVNMADDGGHFANWIVGGIIGGIVGAITAAANGDNIKEVVASAAHGAVSGMIAGAAVDIGLAVVASGGAAALVVAPAIAYLGGFVGNIAGEEVHSVTATGKLAPVDNEMIQRSNIAGVANVAAFGASYNISSSGTKSIATMKPSINDAIRSKLADVKYQGLADILSVDATVCISYVAAIYCSGV